MHNTVQLCLAANNILLMRKGNRAFLDLLLAIALAWKWQIAWLPKDIYYKYKLGDRMIKQSLNSVIAKYRDLSVSRRSIICLSLRLRQIIVLLATDKSRYFAQPRPTIVNCVYNLRASEPWQRAMQSIEDSLKIVQWCECVRDVNEYGIIVVNCAATLV